MSWFKSSKSTSASRRKSIGLTLQQLDERINPSHFRYGNLSWEPDTANNLKIDFKFQQSWRRTFYSGPPNVGSVVTTGTYNFGDGTTAPIEVKVLSIDTAADYFVGEWVTNQGGGVFTPGFSHTYGKAGNYTAFMDSCCRISTSKNNPDGNYHVQTLINAGTGNNPPTSSLPPIVQVQDNTVVTFQIPGFDEDGDPLNWRLSTSAEAGGPNGPFTQPTGLTISKTGMVTWDITDAKVNTTIGNLWSAQVMIEDLTGPGGTVKSSIPVDFLMQVVANTNNAPVLVSNPTGPFQPVAGQLLTFSVTATDPNAGDTITAFQLLNPPAGMTTSGFVPGSNPATLNVSWTPTQAQSGNTFVLTFQATDNQGATGFTSVTISPTANQHPNTNPDTFPAVEDVVLTGSVTTNDNDPENDPYSTVIVSNPLHGLVSLQGDGSFTYTPTGNYSGQDTFSYKGVDAFGESPPAVVTINLKAVADAPTLGTGNTGGSEGSPISLPITAALVDTDGSEALSISITGVPAGATLSAGTPLGGGAYSLTPAQLVGLTITVPDNGAFTLGVAATATEASNSDTATTSGSVSVTVNNVAPTATITGAASVNEGSVYTATIGGLTDPGADAIISYVVNWGDGVTNNIPAGSLPGSGQVTHTYADGVAPGTPRTILLDLIDDDGTFPAVASQGLTVNDVAPVVNAGGNTTVNAGVLFTRAGSFVDPGADSVWTATVNYGDGGGNVPLTLNPDKTFNLSHTYTPGLRTVTVIVNDKDGVTGTATFTVDSVAGAGVEIVTIGDASCPDQRSMVRKLSVTFITQVNIAAGAFSVVRQNGTPYTFNMTTALVAGKTVATLTFTGPGLVGGSLPDANYTLNVNGLLITSGTSTPISNSNFSLGFHRYFGDINGDRRVNDLDLAVLNPVLRSRINQVLYTQPCGGFYFDYDTNGFVDPTADYNQFLARYKTRLNENGTISTIRATGG